MVVTAGQVADSLSLLIPGFVLMKVFYLFGFQSKRSDAQWVIWSILATAPILGLATALIGSRSWLLLPVAITIGVIGGGVLSFLWRRFAPAGVRSEVLIRAWDNVLGGSSRWVHVELKDGRIFRGWQLYAAKSVETDDLDLYLREPVVVVNDEYVALPDVEGLLLERSEIVLIAVLDHDDPAPGAAPTPVPRKPQRRRWWNRRRPG